jgi:hypothetical protein
MSAMTQTMTDDNIPLNEQYILYPSKHEGGQINRFEEKCLVDYARLEEKETTRSSEKLKALKNLSSLDPLIDNIIVEYMLKALILKRLHDAGLMDRYVARYNLEMQNDHRRFSSMIARHNEGKFPPNDLRGLTSHYNDSTFIMNTVLKNDSELAPIGQSIRDDMLKNKHILAEAIKNEIGIINDLIEKNNPEKAKNFQYNWHSVTNPLIRGAEQAVFEHMYRISSLAMTFRDEVVTTRPLDTHVAMMCIRQGLEIILTSPDKALGKTLFPTLVNTAMALGALGINPTDRFTGIGLIKAIYDQPSMTPVIHQAHRSLMKVDDMTVKLDAQLKAETLEAEQKREADKQAEVDASRQRYNDYMIRSQQVKRRRTFTRIGLIAGGILAADQLMFDGAILDKVIGSVQTPHSAVQVANIDQVHTSGFTQFNDRLNVDINAKMFDSDQDVTWISGETVSAKKMYDKDALRDVITDIQSDNSVYVDYRDPSKMLG